MQRSEPVARRLFDLTEPISLVNFFSPEPNDSMAALGFRNYWDGYFAGRSAPLGRVPAEVVHAAFYNFADGEVARAEQRRAAVDLRSLVGRAPFRAARRVVDLLDEHVHSL